MGRARIEETWRGEMKVAGGSGGGDDWFVKGSRTTRLFVSSHVTQAAPNMFVGKERPRLDSFCIRNLEGTSNGQDALLAHSTMSISSCRGQKEERQESDETPVVLFS